MTPLGERELPHRGEAIFYWKGPEEGEEGRVISIKKEKKPRSVRGRGKHIRLGKNLETITREADRRKKKGRLQRLRGKRERILRIRQARSIAIKRKKKKTKSKTRKGAILFVR